MTAVIVLNPAGLATARRIQAALPGARLHGLAERIDEADVVIHEVGPHIRDLFASGTPIVGICAAGILIRALAPLLADKWREPPVIAVAGDGSAVVPLLGGHHGANDLARRLGDLLGCPPAITTSGDLALKVAPDQPPPGWRVANPEAAKPVAAALLAGQDVKLSLEAGDAGWLSGLKFERVGAFAVRVTDQLVQPSPHELVFHPPVLAVGVGCERDAAPEELIELVSGTLAEAGLTRGAVAAVCSIALKADEPAVHASARALGVPARFFPAHRLEQETPRLANPSEIVFRETGSHGVAEAAALAAVGPEGALVVAKTKSRRCTVAIARSPSAIDPAQIGRAQGQLFVVGIGPGTAQWRTPEASAAVAQATDLVGYGLYLDLLGEAASGKTRHETGLGAEIERARLALDLAGEGRCVALVYSGDAGIYALATLVFELMELRPKPEWDRVRVQVVPGVSALQAAAARAGAPINHDFCTISLSDLLTPWPAIEARLKAAAQGDFVVCLYNPVSQRRRDQLTRARDILLEHRPAETPVVLARQLGRDGESVELIPLQDLEPERADMLTIVLIGNSQTRRMRRAGNEWVYTPRGYAEKK